MELEVGSARVADRGCGDRRRVSDDRASASARAYAFPTGCRVRWTAIGADDARHVVDHVDEEAGRDQHRQGS